MRKIIALILTLMLMATCAFAEGGLTMIIDTDMGSMLITEDGTPVTEMGEYDVIYCITYDPCEPERLLYAVTSFDGVLINLSDMEGVTIEEWPEDGGELPEGDDSEIVIDEWEVSDSDEGEGQVEFTEGEEIELEWDEDWSEEDWYDFEGDYFDSLYAVMNAKGEVISDFDYITFTHDVENAVVFATRADSLTDVLDEQGNVLLSTDYALMASDGNGGYFATKPDLNMIDEYGEFPTVSPLVHVASDGTETDTGYSTGTYELGVFNSGYLCVPLYSQPDMEMFDEESEEETEDEDFEDYEEYDDNYYYDAEGYVYLNAQGENAFGKEFTYATMFTDGYAEVEDENYTARLIDTTGNYVTEKEYSGFDRGEPGDDMPIIANIYGGGFDLLDRSELTILASFGDEYGAELFAAQAGGDFIMAYSDTTMMIMDRNGSVIYETGEDTDDVYAYTWYTYCEGQPERILISKGEWPSAKCTLMDTQGNTIGGEYPEMTALSWKDGQGRYLVSSFDVIEENYDGETYYDADYESYLFGVIDQDGNTILETKYPMINCIAANRYWVYDGENYQLMDENGNVLYQPE